MTDPCLPALHTPATLQSWAVWNKAHPWWRPLAIAAGCAAAAAVPVSLIPTVFVSGADVPAVISPVPPAPPAWHEGAGPLPSYGGTGQANSLGYVPPRETSPVFTDFPTPPPVNVPEPASLALLAVGAGGAALVRRRKS